MTHDAIVIGGGPNGLVAANLLADAGWSVSVLEAQPECGGAVRSGVLGDPGFVHDWFSGFYPLGIASPVLRRLRLEEHGLRWRHAPLVLAHPAIDGSSVAISRSLDETCQLIAETSRLDADAWRRMVDDWERLGPSLIAALLSPFPPVRHSARLVTKLGVGRDLARFARFLVLPVRRMSEEHFEADAMHRLLAGLALHADLGPEQTLSGLFGWVLAMLGQTVGFPVVEGGAGNLTRALVERAVARGVTIETNARVDRVLVRDGRAVGVRIAGGEERAAARAVVADVDAPRLLLGLVGPDHLPAGVLDDVRRFHRDHATMKVDWSLDRPVPWTDPHARRAGTVHLVDGLDALTRIEADLVCGLIPARPFLLVGQPGLADPTRQPTGAATLWAYTHLPRRIRGDAAGAVLPDDPRLGDVVVERIEDEIERHAPGFRDLVRSRHVFDPQRLEEHDANLVGGAIAGGTAQLHQQLIFRPIPGTGRAGTPVAGLFLASASAHPGGGVHGGPGANAARAAIVHDRGRRLRRQSSPSSRSTRRLPGSSRQAGGSDGRANERDTRTEAR